jgi:ankyrin repeat protein
MENKEMVQLLLEAGAGPNFENEEGMSDITYAEDSGYTECFWQLIDVCFGIMFINLLESILKP